MENEQQDADEFVFVDSLGHRRRLFVRDDGARIEMPPDAPDGAGINVRFASGNFQEIVSPESGLVALPVCLQRVKYPVFLSWRSNPENGISYWIRNGLGRFPLDTAGSIVIPRRTDGLVRLEAMTTGVNKQQVGGVPSSFSFAGGFPNPFNPSTQISFALPEAGNVSLMICDVLGRQVAQLASGPYEAGYHSVTWSASTVSSGVYFARFRVFDAIGALKFARTNKLLLIK